MPDRIVCLDGHALNPGDLSWSAFEALGELVVHERTPGSAVVERAAGASCLLTNKTPISADALARLDAVRYVGVLATGYDVVDVEAAARRGVIVTNVPTYGTDSVAQHVLALILELVRPVAPHAEAVRRGGWSTSPDWCFALTPIESLAGKTLGLVGVGRIGLAVARIGAAMDMRVVAHDVDWPDEQRLAGLTVERLSLDDLFACADVVSLHCPLTAESHHLVDADRLARMKSSAILVNTSRGPLIDGAALAAALTAGAIAGAGLDVLEVEPPPPDHPLLQAPNCVVTPHIAWYARGARARLMEVAAANLEAFLAGAPVNRVG